MIPNNMDEPATRVSSHPTRPAPAFAIAPVFQPIMASTGFALLDGGLATELEQQNPSLQLDSTLWNASVLLDSPALVGAVHYDYYKRGASDVATTASYQLSMDGVEEYCERMKKDYNTANGDLYEKPLKVHDLICEESIKQAYEAKLSVEREEGKMKMKGEHETSKEKESMGASSMISNRILLHGAPIKNWEGQDAGQIYQGVFDKNESQSNSEQASVANTASTATVEKSEPSHATPSLRDHLLLHGVPMSNWDGYKGEIYKHVGHQKTEEVQGQRRLLVAYSLGSYGAYLANGAEYTGDYGPDVDEKCLMDFHRKRVLAVTRNPELKAKVDVFAFETIPSLLEARAIVRLMRQLCEEKELLNGDKSNIISSWIAFSCKDQSDLNSKESFADAVKLVCDNALIDTTITGASPATVGTSDNALLFCGVGINCTSPEVITPLLASGKEHTKLGITAPRGENDNDPDNQKSNLIRLPFLVYPNSGEVYNGTTKEWQEDTTALVKDTESQLIQQGDNAEGAGKFTPKQVQEWHELGVRFFGGCCRTSPGTIAGLKETLSHLLHGHK
eukprot:Nk52_evm9s1737 gene=Nk52_evmTU9s1737